MQLKIPSEKLPPDWLKIRKSTMPVLRHFKWADIVPTQSWVATERLDKITAITTPVCVVHVDGRNYLADGHHRAYWAMLRDEEFPASYYRAD